MQDWRHCGLVAADGAPARAQCLGSHPPLILPGCSTWWHQLSWSQLSCLTSGSPHAVSSSLRLLSLLDPVLPIALVPVCLAVGPPIRRLRCGADAIARSTHKWWQLRAIAWKLGGGRQACAPWQFGVVPWMHGLLALWLVSCRCPWPSTGSVRLRIGNVTTTAAGRGRVEVYHNAEWKPVCDDDFDDRAATVVCNQVNWAPR